VAALFKTVPSEATGKGGKEIKVGKGSRKSGKVVKHEKIPH
jgi:hypothetical protein